MNIEEETDYVLPQSKSWLSAKAAFHIAFGAILVPGLAPLVAWVLALFKLRDDEGVWRKRTVYVAIVDTLVVGAFALLMWNNLQAARAVPARRVNAQTVQTAPAPAAPPRARIGIRMDPNVDHEPRIMTMSADGPAARAGLRLGDQITAVDGQPSGDATAIADLFAATPVGGVRHLQIRRGTELLAIDVTPSTEVSTPPPLPVVPTPARAPARPRALFDTYEPTGGSWLSSTLNSAKSLGLVALALLVLVVIARRRQVTEMAAPASVVLALAISMLGCLAGLSLLHALHLLSAGSSLIVLSLGASSMMLAAYLAKRRTAPTETLDAPKSSIATFALGTFYLIPCLVRIAVVLAAVLPYTRKAGVTVQTVDLPTTDTSASGVIPLFVLATGILGPIAEEVLFRGVLLPWLRRFMSDHGAIIASALVFAVGHIFYGLGVTLVICYGVILGWARVRTGKLYAPIAIHMLINLAMCFIAARR